MMDVGSYQKLYQTGMFLMVAFILGELYQSNAIKERLMERTEAHGHRIALVEHNLLKHLIGHNAPGVSLPVGLPLIKLSERRNQLRVEFTK